MREADPNPYATPSSDVGAPGPRVSRRRGWKLYLWALVGLLALGYALSGVSWMQAADILDAGASAVSLSALFGFAYRRRIGVVAFWRVWLPIAVVWNAALILLLEPAGLAYQTDEFEATTALEKLAELAVILPLFVALYRYAWRSPELWSETPQ